MLPVETAITAEDHLVPTRPRRGPATPRVPTTDSSSELPTQDPPQLLGGRYQIEALIGAGGMGSVYRARDLELDELVALKIVGTLDRLALGRFRAEVKLARRVSHANVARTYDIGEDGSARFLTMEYVAGESLRRRLGHRLSPATARALAIGICEGCAAIHDADVVHGDLKPENVVVTAADHPKVSDFGLATLRGGDQRHAGTPLYMAPEQHRGAPADQRTDLYALGIIVHELFAEKRPNGALSAQLPADVRRIVERCLDLDPSRRPMTARELVAVLDTSALDVRPRRASTAGLRPERDAVGVAVRSLHADDPNDAYLGAALAGDIVRVLSTSRELQIRAQPLAPGAEISDVDAVVDGNVRRIGDQLQLALRVVSHRDGYLLWGRTLTVALVDVLGAVEEATDAIAAALGTRAAKRTASSMRDPALIELYLKARDLDYATWHDHEVDNANLYQQILVRQPNDPLILACYSRALTCRGIREPGALARAQVAAERAIALAPELPEAHLAVAIRLFIGNDCEGALRAMVRGLELSPSSAFGHSILGYAMCEVGFVERGLAQLDFAISLERDLPMAWSNSVRYASLNGRHARVDELLASPPPIRAVSTEWLYWVTRARVAICRGGHAPELLAQELESSPFGATSLLRPIIPSLRHDQSAAGLHAALMPFFAGDPANHRVRALGHMYGAELAMFLGHRDAARASLHACVEEGACDVIWIDHSPMFDSLRDAAWFQELQTKLAQRAERVCEVFADATGV